MLSRAHTSGRPAGSSCRPHLHQDWAHPCHICTGTRLAPATSAPTHRTLYVNFVCAQTGFEEEVLGCIAKLDAMQVPSQAHNTATSAPGLGSPLPHLHRDWAHPCHICTGTRLAPATSAPGLGSPLPHLHRDWALSCHICTGTRLAPSASAPGLGSPPPHLRRLGTRGCRPASAERNGSAERSRSPPDGARLGDDQAVPRVPRVP